ncbi:MAG TPA: hypothetical protein VEU11_12340 [Terriglobales bacterium]|nr:hypothetical protein [Terriglobales bacterium]
MTSTTAGQGYAQGITTVATDHQNNRIRQLPRTAQAQPVIAAVLNGASYSALLAPGCWAVIYGSGLATTSATAQTVPLQTTLGGTSVTVGGVAAPLLYVSPTQINVLIPFEVQLPTGGIGLATVPVVVSQGGASSTPYNIPINRDAPAIFTRNAQGTGPAHVFDSKFRPLNSVAPGEVVILYAAGLGPTNPPASSASGASPAVVLYRVVDEVDIYIGEQKVDPSNVEFAGLAPGFPGVYQLNVKVPPGLVSDRLSIREGGWQSNVVQAGITASQNVANVTGSIQGIYPPASGPTGASVALQAAAFKVSFTILPAAGPFTVAAVGEVGSSIVTIDPVAGTFTASVTVPTAATRVGDFSGTELTPVYDYAGCSTAAVCPPFPGNVIPVSRLDPLMVEAEARLPEPNASGPAASTLLFQASGSAKAGSTFTIDGTDQSTANFYIGAFGAWLALPYGPFATHTSTLALYVDGTLVASGSVMYSLVHR